MKNLLILILCLFTFTISAQEIVSDPAAEQTLNKMYELLKGEIDAKMGEIAASTQVQTRILQNTLTGATGVGGAMSSTSMQTFSNWAPSAQDLANMVEQGLQTGSLADQIQYYNKKFPIPKANDITPGQHDSASANYAVFSAVNTNAALSAADKSFDNTQRLMEQVNFLYSLIDRQLTLKQSVDVNSALLVKVIHLQAEVMRLQALGVKMQAVAQQQSNTNRLLLSKFARDIS